MKRMKKIKVVIQIPVTITYDSSCRQARHVLLRSAKQKAVYGTSKYSISDSVGHFKLGRATNINLAAFRKQVLIEAARSLDMLGIDRDDIHGVARCVAHLYELSEKAA